MSTHACLVCRRGNNVDVISVYSDGCPNIVGRQLLEHWTDRAKVNILFDCGMVKSLGDNLASTAFAKDDRGASPLEYIAYGAQDLRHACKHFSWCHYFYYYLVDINKWYLIQEGFTPILLEEYLHPERALL